MSAFLSIPFPAWLVGILSLLAAMLGFAAAMSWNAYRAPGKLGAMLANLDSGTRKAADDDDDDDDEEPFTVLVKFKDGSEARWRDVESWQYSNQSLDLDTKHGGVTLSLANVLWAVDEDAAPERLESKKSV